MNHKKCFASISGLPSQLIAVGGGTPKGDVLSTCESFSLSSSKWSVLPPLKTARKWPGTLNSLKAFCFCGTNRYLKSMQCIESIQTDTQPEWKSLALCKDIGKIAHLAAVSF